MSPETFNLAQFQEQHQEVKLNPDQQAKLDVLKRELQVLIDGELSEKTDEQFKEIVRRIIEVYDEHKEGLTQETIQRSQKMLDFVFGESRFNLQAEYDKGNILGFSKEQLEAIEQANKLNLSEFIIIPGQIPRDEIINTVENVYQRKSGNKIKWNPTSLQTDLHQSSAAKNLTRPPTFYLLAFNPEQASMYIDYPRIPHTDIDGGLEFLNQIQQENPNLNLKGLTLPEAVLIDTYFFANDKVHADPIGWHYCLEEIISDEAEDPPYLQMPRLSWNTPSSQFEIVLADLIGGQLSGARIAALPSEK
jgi:hypothetical protein